MDRDYQRFLASGSAERIVGLLSEQQHLRPHQSLAQALAAAGERAGFCPNAADEAMGTLQLDPGTLIGRLRRTELVQLGRTVYRIWRQNAAGNVRESQPA